MGTWGVSLYSGDFAADLRATIRAVLRLPFDADRLAEIVVSTESVAAENPDSEDHSTFWLVLADQFARHGVICDRVIENALEIIDSGRDLDMQARLRQTAPGLEKRRRMLAELRERIVRPSSSAARKVLQAPQPFVMHVGDALIYPTCVGQCRNPYVADVERLKIYGPKGGQVWAPDGWGAMVIIERGLTFGFLAWYRPVVVRSGWDAAPDLQALLESEWRLEQPGTCSPTHFRRLGLAQVGTLEIDADKVQRQFGPLAPGQAQAINDIAIANRMRVSTSGGTPPLDGRVQQRAFRLRELIR